MCGTCGCSDPKNAVTMTDLETGSATVLRNGAITATHGAAQSEVRKHEHAASHDHHEHGHSHAHDHEHHHHDHDDVPHVHGPNGEVITLETAVLAKNDQIATRNRGWFLGRGVLALNLVSSPGAGKTALLERTIRDLGGEMDICVVEGDQMTTNDAERIREAGARAVQINTGAGCHLEADMIARAIETLNPQSGAVMFIENVGNLVCPAMFDLGERMKVAIISTTEGEDKPLKYPHMFQAADLVIINKIDLAPHVDFDEERCLDNIGKVNPQAKVVQLSAKTGEGMDSWLDALRGLRKSEASIT
ncbi:MAG: hydrogenase nickel incorporation protein HypB [Alphaproteobacteria bacterium]|nr:hydrogenase nickel incorporation protein HypB [Alphaproteobacteria bacterium]